MPKCSVSKLIATYHTKTDQKERERERETDKRERERERERERCGGACEVHNSRFFQFVAYSQIHCLDWWLHHSPTHSTKMQKH